MTDLVTKNALTDEVRQVWKMLEIVMAELGIEPT